FLKTKLGLREYFKTETAIMCCHGGNGENGILEAVFESCGIYSSAGNIDSLAVCMNKYLFKQMMYGLKIPTVKGFKINEKEYLSNTDEIICKIKKINFPIVLKPNNGGSSIGLFIVNNIGELEEKLGYAFEFDSEVLIEKYIPKTREFNVAVLGDYNDFELSEIDEPLKENEILTFSDKYCSSRSGKLGKLNNDNKLSMASSFRNFPANISDRIKNRLYKLTKKIFKSLNLRGVVRIDYLYDEINNKIYVCEVNAIPGSLAYYFFNNDKLIINEFVIKLIKLAKKYKNSKFCVKNEFITDILN
ncbi:MAG: ATP-grasp domain-containing protein, partial [Clostridia bacterium]|nr:ATP-grasp domain-containing protein [Clostridia bacterium]